MVEMYLDSPYTIRNENLEKVDKIKDLGVTFDKSLKFKEHISEKTSKVYSVLKYHFVCYIRQ